MIQPRLGLYINVFNVDKLYQLVVIKQHNCIICLCFIAVFLLAEVFMKVFSFVIQVTDGSIILQPHPFNFALHAILIWIWFCICEWVFILKVTSIVLWIQSRYLLTLVYMPPWPLEAHPEPQETTPITVCLTVYETS